MGFRRGAPPIIDANPSLVMAVGTTYSSPTRQGFPLWFREWFHEVYEGWRIECLIADIAIFLLLLLVVLRFCDWSIRRASENRLAGLHVTTTAILHVVMASLFALNATPESSSGHFCFGWPATFIEQHVQFTWLLLDGTVAVVVLAVTAATCEWVIRRSVPLHVHLSTAIFLMFVGGGVLGANCFPHSVYVVGYSGGEGGYAYGWPFHLIDVFGNERGVANVIVPEGWSIDWWGALANIAVLLLILAATATVCEFLIRRNTPRAHQESGNNHHAP